MAALLGGLLRGMRPAQWVKNVLVFAAPATAGVLSRPGPLRHALVAFAAFCLVSSGTYLLNDVLDVQADRRHPRKCVRPVASGLVSLPLAVIAGALLMMAGVGLVIALGRPLLVAVLAGYVVLTLAYSVWLKHVAVLDLLCVAAGFLLRAVAGGVAVDVRLSQWFLIVATFGSIYLVVGKRHAEHVDLGEARGLHRRTLGRYSLAYLAHVRTMSSAVTVLAYSLWALDRGHREHSPWAGVSILPVVIGLLRYELLVEEGQGEAPEAVLRHDRLLQVLGVAWIVLVIVEVYVR